MPSSLDRVFVCQNTSCRREFKIGYTRNPSRPKYCSRACFHEVRRLACPQLPATCHPEKPQAAHGLCLTCYVRQRRRTHPKQYASQQVVSRRHHLRKKYSLSIKDYDDRLAQQSGGCAICGSASNGSGRGGRAKYLAVDHCHATNAVRGLLCDGCNQGLGNFKDNVEYLHRAAEYLRRSVAS